MASKYGLNFGFRRSDESMAIREGRLRTPATGTFRIGTLVTRDPAAPGFLKVCATDVIGAGGEVGLLTQDEQFIASIYAGDPAGLDSHSWGLAKNNTLSTIFAGAGVKVWFRNSPAGTTPDGRAYAAVTMVTLTSVAVSDYLKWNGTQYVKGTGPTDSMLRVTAVNTTVTATSLGYVEAVLVA